jgi:hypothetical protein
MRSWHRAVVDVTCGLCTERIASGEPVQRISLPALKRPLWRCARCVGPAPPDLPAVIELRPPEPAGFAPVRELAQRVAVDFTAKAAGD